jgi:hypothetical protein
MLIEWWYPGAGCNYCGISKPYSQRAGNVNGPELLRLASPRNTNATTSSAPNMPTPNRRADPRMISERLDVLLEGPAHALGMPEQVDLIVDLLHFQRDGGGDRMARVG